MPPLQEWHIHARAHACAITQRPFVEGERIASALYWRAGQYERIDMCLEAWADSANRVIPAKKTEEPAQTHGAPQPEPKPEREAGTADAAPHPDSPAMPAESSAAAAAAPEAQATTAPAPQRRAAKPRMLRPVSHWQSTYERAPSAGDSEPLRKGDAEALLRRLLEEENPAHVNVRYILALMLERKRILKPLGTRTEDGRTILLYLHAATGDNFIIEDPALSLHQLGPVQDEVAEMLKAPAPDPVPPAG